ARGLTSLGVTAAVVNLGLKLVARRRRPDVHGVPSVRRVPMPHSRSFPSGHSAAAVAFATGGGAVLPGPARPLRAPPGHSAAAFGFATGVGAVLPGAAIPLRALAVPVAYSRVHTGVHYPGDVIAGALTGVTLAELTGRAISAYAATRGGSLRAVGGRAA